MGINFETGEIIASKEVNLINSSYTTQDALENEIKILQNLKHQNIVKYLGFARNKEAINIYLEYISGGSLASIISKYGSLPEPLLKTYTRQILSGLEYLHWHRIVHGDLKPANILVNKDGNCKLTDFGSAKFLHQNESESVIESFGTINYCAPELLKGEEASRFCDIWSFGCIIVEILTGKPPWHSISNNVPSIMNKINAILMIAKEKSGPPIGSSDVSDSLKKLLKKCFKRNPQKRINVCGISNHPFYENKFELKPLDLLGSLNNALDSPFPYAEPGNFRSLEMINIKNSPNRMQMEDSNQIFDDLVIATQGNSGKKSNPSPKNSTFRSLLIENLEGSKPSHNKQDRFDDSL